MTDEWRTSVLRDGEKINVWRFYLDATRNSKISNDKKLNILLNDIDSSREVEGVVSCTACGKEISVLSNPATELEDVLQLWFSHKLQCDVLQ